MPTNGLRRTLDRLRKALTPDRPDEQLLREFIAARDETAFARAQKALKTLKKKRCVMMPTSF